MSFESQFILAGGSVVVDGGGLIELSERYARRVVVVLG